MSGSYVTVEVLLEDGQPCKQYQVKGKTWIEAKEEKPYQIKVTNKSHESVCVNIMVDGQSVASWLLHAGRTAQVEDVVSQVIHTGHSVKEVRKQLIFARPKLFEGTGEGQERPLDQQLAGDGAESKLGCISVEVFDAVKTEPRPCGRTVVSSVSFDNVAVGEKALKKKGAFKTTSALSATEKVVEVAQRNSVSCYARGSHKYETVDVCYGSIAMLLILGVPPLDVCYGSIAMLLILGVPPREFMKNNTNRMPSSSEPLDLTEDDAKKPAAKKPKLKSEGKNVESSSSAGGPSSSKPVKPDPGASTTFLDFTT